MSSQTFSRAFLQAAPEREKERRIEWILNTSGFVQNLQNAAIEGKTQYIYTHNTGRVRGVVAVAGGSSPVLPEITNGDLIAAFKRKFPDCDISYQETWVDVTATNRVLTKGIVIDWS